MGNALKKLFWVSRPISWPNTAYPFFVGYVLVFGGLPSGWQLATLIFGTLYFLGPYNLLMYGVNDVYDYESDIKNPRKGGVEGMRESRAFHPTILRAVTLTNTPFLLYLFIVSDWPARAILTLVVFAALAYSLKGLRFKEIPILDSLTSSFHFVGPLLFAITLVGFQPAAWPWLVAFFLWGMASHAFGAVQDIIPDKKGKIHSVATALGARVTVWMSFILYLSAALIVAFQGNAYILIAIAAVTYCLNVAPYLFVTTKTSAITNKGWKRFLWLNYVNGAVITMVIVSINLL
jgi:4-hydroxybenzoate polyprenyltransferase